MKNIHLILTDKLSRLGRFIDTNNLFIRTSNDIPRGENVNIYITSDEEIKEGDWFYLDMSDNDHPDEIHKMGKNNWSETGGINFNNNYAWSKCCKKIILTTDQDLIKDGVQSIDDNFLEWFVQNPSCEEVEVGYGFIRLTETDNKGYWISIPDKQFEMQQEEPKQETLEKREPYWDLVDAKAKQNNTIDLDAYAKGVQDGAKWQAERMYSEEDMRECVKYILRDLNSHNEVDKLVNFVWIDSFNKWFENNMTPKETLEEAAESYVRNESDVTLKLISKYSFKDGAKWQAKRMYSEEDMIKFAEFVATYPDKNRNYKKEILHAKSKYDGAERTIDLFEQFKKK